MDSITGRGHTPDKAEFHQAIARYSERWFGACLRITGDAGLAEDALQDALLSAWRKRGQYQSTAQLETWIHRIAVNAALQLLRRQRPGRQEPLEVEPPDETRSPERLVQQAALAGDLERALGGLSDMERVCFVLKHLEQWQLSEIATELGGSVGSVKQALFRGVKKLRVSMTAAGVMP